MLDGSISICLADNHCIGSFGPNLALLRPTTLRKRFWQGGVALLIVVGTFATGNFFVRPDRSVSSGMLGHDFLAFYTAGTFARQGRFDQLYDLPAMRQAERLAAQQNGLDLDGRFGPYWNPPFYAWVFSPLSALPYRRALSIWTGINLLCLGLALLTLIRMLPSIVARPPKISALRGEPLPLKFKRDWRDWALVPLLVCVSMPFIQAITHGQNTFMSLMLLGLVVTAWRNRMPVSAGLACGMMLYKPQLAAVVAGMLVLSMGLRVCLGLGFVAGLLMLITALTMPDSLGDYLYKLPLNLTSVQVDQPYLWDRHVTLKAFWRLLLQGRSAGETTPTVALLTSAGCSLVALGLLGAWWRTRTVALDDCWTGETRTLARDRLIGATITAMPLLMPFYFDYDLLLLAVPAVLFAGEISARPPGARLDRLQRMLVGAWIALYLWLTVNPLLAAASGVNVSVILLSTVCMLSILRASRSGRRTTSIYLPQIQHVTVKRAA